MNILAGGSCAVLLAVPIVGTTQHRDQTMTRIDSLLAERTSAGSRRPAPSRVAPCHHSVHCPFLKTSIFVIG